MARSPDPPADPPRDLVDDEPTLPISGEQFRAIAENTVDWENWHSPTGKLLWVNAAVQRVTGYEPAEYHADRVRPDLENLPDAPLPEGLIVRTPAEDEMRTVWDAATEVTTPIVGMALIFMGLVIYPALSFS